MAATTKLIVFNDALRELGSHPLANLSTPCTSLQELSGAFDHAVEYLLGQVDWNFARRRAPLTGSPDASFAPYTYRYTRPTDYLRKLWIKLAATDEFQIEHAEVAAVFYGYEPTALIEYVSDTASNYDPTNWPPHFTRCVVLYLALLTGPKLARTGPDDAGAAYKKLDMALADAERAEAVFNSSEQIPADRLPIMRQAIDLAGLTYAGSMATHANADLYRQEMNKAWGDAIAYLLARVDWNFARRRAAVTGVSDSAFPPFTYRFSRPADYLRKLWLKTNAADEFQIEHAEVGTAFYSFDSNAIIEYVSGSTDNYDPANWPPRFAHCAALYLAAVLVAKMARDTAKNPSDEKNATAKPVASIDFRQLDAELIAAERAESVFNASEQIEADRLPIMRRAFEIMGQVYTGAMPLHAEADQLRYQMNRAWTAAVRFVLEQAPWNFALRRATLTGSADAASFPPYTVRLDRPDGFLKRVWIRADPNDAHEADYAEASGYFWGYAGTKIMEYVAADAAALSVANWPQSFAELIATYLASQVASPTAVVTTDNEGRKHQQESPRDALSRQFLAMVAAAETAEASQHQNKNIPANRLSIMRRAFEIMGQQLAGFTAVGDANSRLRWQMNLAWADAVSYILEAAAWNFATKRALLTTGADAGDIMPGEEVGGIIEGYSVEGGSGDGESPFDQYAFAGYRFAWYLPADLRHKIWLKDRASSDFEIDYQIIRDAIFTNRDPCVLEYIAEDDWTTDPDNWPNTFRETMAARLAFMVVPDLTIEQDSKGRGRIKADGLRDKLEAYYLRALGDAKIKDAIQQAVKTIPLGRFARARQGSIGTTSLRRWN